VASNVAGTNTCLFTVTVVAQNARHAVGPSDSGGGHERDVLHDGMGSGPFSYQWFHEGAPLAGQTNPCLSLIEVSRAAGGEYCVRVSSPCSLTTNAPTSS
jgi:hypothetical protein